MMTELFGWCLDARCSQCRETFTTQHDVTHTCTCECHKAAA